MTSTLTNVNDMVDNKYLITRTMANQAEAGNIVHIMSAKNGADGFSLEYRVTATGQNFNIQFKRMEDFIRWARPDPFITRNYDAFTKDEIVHYIKVTNKSFASFGLPILIVLMAIVWAASLIFLQGTTAIIAGAAGSIVSLLLVLFIYKKRKSSIKMKMYYKVGTSKWGVKFK